MLLAYSVHAFACHFSGLCHIKIDHIHVRFVSRGVTFLWCIAESAMFDMHIVIYLLDAPVPH